MRRRDPKVERPPGHQSRARSPRLSQRRHVRRRRRVRPGDHRGSRHVRQPASVRDRHATRVRNGSQVIKEWRTHGRETRARPVGPGKNEVAGCAGVTSSSSKISRGSRRWCGIWRPTTFNSRRPRASLYRAMTPLIREALAATGSTRIVDLCSGGSGPLTAVIDDLRQVGNSRDGHVDRSLSEPARL